MPIKAICLPERLACAVDQLRGEKDFADAVLEAVTQWIRQRQRQQDDEMIIRAAAQRRPEQIAEEASIVKLSSDSALRIMEGSDA